MNTPWGKSDSKITITRGISWVGTASHGGLAITPLAALQYLSTPAVARATKYGNYYFFEEDCDYAIAFLELHALLASTSVLEFSINVPTKEALINSLSRWHADYLIERGVEPEAEGLRWFNENRKSDSMRADRSPDLIVSASGDWKTGVPKGMVEVTTADGKTHLVWAQDYAKRNTNLTLLSSFDSVPKPEIKARTWEDRVRALESEGLTRSDAQAAIDAEDSKGELQ
jgi:hypothetical protein